MPFKKITAFLEKLGMKNIYNVLKNLNNINLWIYTFSYVLNICLCTIKFVKNLLAVFSPR